MDNQTPSPAPQPLSPSGKGWLAACLVLALTIAIGFLLQSRFVRAPQQPATEGPVPVAAPDLGELEEVEQYTGGRPIPAVSQERSAGTVDVALEHVRGNPDARISIVEYADMTNMYPRLIHADLKQFVETHPDVNWVFRHYPVPENALDYPAAYMSECIHREAGDPVFWLYLDAVYGSELQTLDQVLALAQPLVPTMEAVQRCYESLATENDVKDDKRLASTQGKVQVLPTFFFVDHITGQQRVLDGIDTMDFFQAILDEMLRVTP